MPDAPFQAVLGIPILLAAIPAVIGYAWRDGRVLQIIAGCILLADGLLAAALSALNSAREPWATPVGVLAVATFIAAAMLRPAAKPTTATPATPQQQAPAPPSQPAGYPQQQHQQPPYQQQQYAPPQGQYPQQPGQQPPQPPTQPPAQ